MIHLNSQSIPFPSTYNNVMDLAHTLWTGNRSDVGDEMDWMSGMEMVRNRIESDVWSSFEIGIGFGNECN